MKTITSADLRRDLTKVLSDLPHQSEERVVTRSGQPIAVLVSMEKWEEIQSILVTWEEIQDPESRNKLRAAKADLTAGRVTPHEEIVARHLQRRTA